MDKKTINKLEDEALEKVRESKKLSEAFHSGEILGIETIGRLLRLSINEEEFKNTEETVEQHRGWISVEDKLPRQEERVLVWHSKDGRVEINMLRMDYKFGYENTKGKVTHWKPLPTPPKC